jgi:hypothetical protein
LPDNRHWLSDGCSDRPSVSSPAALSLATGGNFLTQSPLCGGAAIDMCDAANDDLAKWRITTEDLTKTLIDADAILKQATRWRNRPTRPAGRPLVVDTANTRGLTR